MPSATSISARSRGGETRNARENLGKRQCLFYRSEGPDAARLPASKEFSGHPKKPDEGCPMSRRFLRDVGTRTVSHANDLKTWAVQATADAARRKICPKRGPDSSSR